MTSVNGPHAANGGNVPEEPKKEVNVNKEKTQNDKSVWTKLDSDKNGVFNESDEVYKDTAVLITNALGADDEVPCSGGIASAINMKNVLNIRERAENCAKELKKLLDKPIAEVGAKIKELYITAEKIFDHAMGRVTYDTTEEQESRSKEFDEKYGLDSAE